MRYMKEVVELSGPAGSKTNETEDRFIKDVTAMMVCAQHTQDVFHVRQAAMYMGLQFEELAEKVDVLFPPHPALGYRNGTAAVLEAFGTELKRGVYDHLFMTCDRKKMLDADADIAVVTIGAMRSQGANVQGALNEVTKKNLEKFPGGKAILNENGKIVKPQGWVAPDLTPFICTVTK